jgi:hypothetical protein
MLREMTIHEIVHCSAGLRLPPSFTADQVHSMHTGNIYMTCRGSLTLGQPIFDRTEPV